MIRFDGVRMGAMGAVAAFLFVATSTPFFLISPEAKGEAASSSLMAPPVLAAVVPPRVYHPIVGRFYCLHCHGPWLDADHATASNENCLSCHRAAGPYPAVAATSSSSPPVVVPQVVHKLDGFSPCLSCHGDRLPSSHAGRGDDICLSCHQAMAGARVEAKSE